MSASDAETRAAIRRMAREARQNVTERPVRAAAIAERLASLEVYRAARTICWYVGVRDEVPTLEMIARAGAEARIAVVPWRAGDALELYRVRGPRDLERNSFELLEPSAAVRSDPALRVGADAVDLYVVPGVAFDRHGGRLGYGRGYYDRLLARVRPDAAIVGLAFEAQMVERVPTGPYDVPMQRVVTEAAVYAPEA